MADELIEWHNAHDNTLYDTINIMVIVLGAIICACADDYEEKRLMIQLFTRTLKQHVQFVDGMPSLKRQ